MLPIFFKTTNKDISGLNIDYSKLKNFVRFSSARKRLDNFVLKLTKISRIQKELTTSNSKIESYKLEVEAGNILPNIAEDSIRIIRQNDIEINSKKLKDLIETLTPYEKYLYYENTNDS